MVPSILMATWEAAGPWGRVCWVSLLLFHHRVALGILDLLTIGILFRHLNGHGLDEPGRIIGLKVLDHAL